MTKEELKKAEYLANYWIFYPDLALDLMAPKEGSIKLHMDQRVFMRSVTRFFSVHGCFPRGFGKCVAGDTTIFTTDGQKEIGEYFDYQSDGKETIVDQDITVINRYGNKAVSYRGIYSGYKPTKHIYTKEGYDLEGTYVHPVLVMDQDGELKFKRADELKIGDRIAINRNNDIHGNNIDISREKELDIWVKSLSNQKRSHLRIRPMCTELTEEFSYVIGLLVGDGCLTRENVIGFTNADSDIIKSYCDFMENTFDVKVSKRSKYDYYISDVYLRQYLNLLGLSKVDAHGKSIPDIILCAPKEMKRQFLRGLMDTDGGVENNIVSFCSVSEKLIKQVQMMLLNFGIISRIRRKTYKQFSHYLLYISGCDLSAYEREIGFACDRKSKKLHEIASKTHNTNKDVIPYQKEYVQEFYKDVKNKNPYLHKKISHVLSGECDLSYKKLNDMISLVDADCSSVYSHFVELRDCNYFYAEVSDISDGMNHVYDLSVPESHSFISNGFVSHNTFLELATMMIVAIRYPNIELAVTAQTKENAAALIKDKYNELIRYYPMIQKEVVKTSFVKGDALIILRNGARID